MATESDSNNPYVGPRPFEHTKEDRERFFGRTEETQEITSLIFGHPLLLVYAQSGAGKTSLFNASVAAALEKEGFEVFPLTRVRGSTPKEINLEEIKNQYIFNALLNLKAGADPAVLVDETLVSFLNACPRSIKSKGHPAPRVIIFDQFEELFTFTPVNWREQRDGFFLQVVDALAADPLLRVVFVIREDFLAQLDPYAYGLPEHLRIRYRLERLQEDAALRAIKQPLSGTTRHYAPGAAEYLVKELLFTQAIDSNGKPVKIEGQYVEPVQLQVVCLTLWSKLSQETIEITEDHLKGFDVDLALSNFYDAAMDSVSEKTSVEEGKLRHWFEKYLITPMQTRNTIYRGKELTGGIPNTSVDALVNSHLILAENRGGVWWYELTHDRFIEAILASNKDWFAKKRGSNPLTNAAQDWELSGRQDGDLLRGKRFVQANKWAQEHPDDMNDLERDFLTASQVRYQRKLEASAKTARKLRFLAIGLIAGIFVATLAAGSAFWLRNQAEKARKAAEMAKSSAISAKTAAEDGWKQANNLAIQARNAEVKAHSGQLAQYAITNLKSSPQLSLLLAIEAYNLSQTVEADDALRQAIDASRVRAILKQQNQVSAIAFSPQGDYIVTGDASGAVHVWDVESGARLDEWETLHKNSILAISVSPDGDIFTTVDADGNVFRWDTASISYSYFTPDSFDETLYGTNAVAFSPDGELLMAADNVGSVFIWNVDTTKLWATLKGHRSPVNAISISPSSDRVVTTSQDGTAILWDLKTGNELASLTKHTSGISAVIFSHDGKLIVTAGDDGTARIWQATDGKELALLTGHVGSIVSAAFSPKGDFLATVGDDKTARLWNVEDAIRTNGVGELGTVLFGHEDRINTVSFSPDGQILATGSADGTAILWRVPSGEMDSVLKGHSSSVNIVDFRPDGKLLATASSDKTAILWDIRSGEAQKNLRGHKASVWEAAFSPKGNKLATTGEDGLIIWDMPADISTGEIVAGTPLEKYGGQGFDLDFSADNKLLAVGGLEKDGRSSIVTLLDVSALPSENILGKHRIQNGLVFDLAFNPDGSLLAIDEMDHNFEHSTVHLWHLSGDQEEKLYVPGSIFYGIAFSPDGTLLAASGGNSSTGAGMVKVWDVSSLGKDSNIVETATIRTKDPLLRTVFSPDRSILAGGSFDGTIYLWDVGSLVQTGGADVKVTTLSGHKNTVIGLAFSRDGNLLASGDQDGIIRLWDVSAAVETGGQDTEKSILRVQAGGVYSVAFSPDGLWLAATGEDEITHLLTINTKDLITLACQRATRNLTQVEWDTYIGNEKAYHQTCPKLPYHPSVLDAMIELARTTAYQGRIDSARDILVRVNELDPARELSANQMLAGFLVELGQQYAYEGDPERALSTLQQAKKFDPSMEVKPEQELATILLDVGREFASGEDFDRALEIFRQAASLDSSVGDPKAKLAYALVELGRQWAMDGDIDRATKFFNQAHEVDPTIDVDINAEISSAQSQEYIDLAKEYLSSSNYARAVEALDQAIEHNPELESQQVSELADLYNSLCWNGSIDGFAKLVLPICERAVKLAVASNDSYIGAIRDSRGLARALTADFAGAIEDFTYYLDWARNNGQPETSIALRESWIVLLKKGQNPFDDPQYLQEIRYQ